MTRRLPLLLLALLFLPATGATAADGPVRWWNRDWAYRKRIALSSPAATDVPCAHVRLSTGGRAREDGADIRVVTPGGTEVPRAVVARGPGDLFEVAFPVGREREWYVYYGNPDAGAPRESWAPDRGLVLETRERAEGNPKDWPSMEKILASSTRVFGGAYWPQVFDGENPFGPSDDYVSDYRGFLLAPRDGTYTFYTASDEASFLFVDGKLVVSWPGWHDARQGAWAKFKGTIDLAAGLHPFRYAHVERRGAQAMAAYWQPPGAKKAVVIPPGAFPAPLDAEIVRHETLGKSVAADFTVKTEGKWAREDRVYPALTFRAEMGPPGTSYRWSFGDGLFADGPVVTHVFLAGGGIEVTLAVMSGGETDTVTRRIRVPDEWTRFDRNDDRTLARFARIAATYPGRLLDADSLAKLAFLLGEAGRTDALLPILRAAVADGARLSPEERFAAAMRLGEQCRDRGLDLEGAAWAFTRAATAAGRNDPERELAARVALAEAHLLLGGDADLARKLLETAVEALGSSETDTARRAWLRLGDARMLAKDGEGARAAYERAERIAGGESGDRLLRKAAAARSAMTYLETKGDREEVLQRAESALADWEWNAPTDRWSGIHRLARAEALERRGRPDLAVRELTPIADANPDSEYAPESLKRLADLARAAGDEATAAALLARLKRDYPWSPLAK